MWGILVSSVLGMLWNIRSETVVILSQGSFGNCYTYFDCQDWGWGVGVCYWHLVVKARDAAKRLKSAQDSFPQQGIILAQIVSSAEVEKQL